MSWYEHQPFSWILKNLTARQITNLILWLIVLIIFLSSYYVYIDAVQSIRNPTYLFIFKNITILAVVIFILMILLTFELHFFLGLG
ncbi:MAG: hypothetical protein QMD36_04485 [Candidatus Aenigmarchaeota archaeon]|nr:hypothetical protein [Candidatus Aenigmarchaeota archaeon]